MCAIRPKSSCCEIKLFMGARVLYLRRKDRVKGMVERARRVRKERETLLLLHSIFLNTHLFSSDGMCEDTVCACICRDSNVSALNWMRYSGTHIIIFLSPTLLAITITTNNDRRQRKRWQCLHVGIQFIILSSGFPALNIQGAPRQMDSSNNDECTANTRHLYRLLCLGNDWLGCLVMDTHSECLTHWYSVPWTVSQ